MKFIHCTIEDFFEKITDNDIILFGASIQPIEAMERLKEEGTDLTDRVVALLDNSLEKQGKSYLLGTRELTIQPREYLKTINMDRKSILVTSRFYAEIIKQLDAMEELKDVTAFAYPCMLLSDEETYENKYRSRITDQALFEYQEYLDVQGLNEAETEKRYADMEKYLMGKNGELPRVLPSVVLLHSNKCTLQCKNCCDLIPHTKQPYYIGAKEALADLELLLKGVDKCIRVDLTDGEPFLYKEMDSLLESLIHQPKVETIFMYTNATVCPSEPVLRLLQNKKCFLFISDYGLGQRTDKFIGLMNEYQIHHKVLTNMQWMDFQIDKLKKRPETREFIRYDFLRCGNKKCSKPLFHGRLYGCMPAFRYASEGIFASEKDFIELRSEDNEEMLWEKIKHICMLDFIETCQYCNFGNTALPIIQAGR